MQVLRKAIATSVSVINNSRAAEDTQLKSYHCAHLLIPERRISGHQEPASLLTYCLPVSTQSQSTKQMVQPPHMQAKNHFTQKLSVAFSLLSVLERGKEECGRGEGGELNNRPSKRPSGLSESCQNRNEPTPTLLVRHRKHEHRGKGKRQLEVQGEKYFPYYYERLLCYF